MSSNTDPVHIISISVVEHRFTYEDMPDSFDRTIYGLGENREMYVYDEETKDWKPL